MPTLSPLEVYRLKWKPTLPTILNNFEFLTASSDSSFVNTQSSELKSLFPQTFDQPILTFKHGSVKLASDPLRVAVVFSGGQAPGGHNVISGLFDSLQKLNPLNVLIGFCNGPEGIIKNKSIVINESIVNRYRNQGGFDMIGSGRTKIETAEQLAAAELTMRTLNLDGLVVIGGDDSNTNAAFLAEFFLKKGLKTRVIGVPKTIDGDLKNAFIGVSFGFDTATKVYSEIIGNILKDAVSSKKYYYFIKLMGRSASHIVLECALRTQPNLAFIGEEVEENKQSLQELVNQIADMICLRAEKGKNYGAILIPEGIIEFIPEFKQMIQELNALLANNPCELEKNLSPEASHCLKSIPESIRDQFLLDRDPHGNVQVSKIETERLFIALVEKELHQRKEAGTYKGVFSAQPLFCGYEGRSALPSHFDCQYCYALGFMSTLLILSNATGYISCIGNLTQPVEEWTLTGVPIFNMLHMEKRGGKVKSVIRKALVDLQDRPFIELSMKRLCWILDDDYCCPGPIQFEGPKEITDSCPLTM